MFWPPAHQLSVLVPLFHSVQEGRHPHLNESQQQPRKAVKVAAKGAPDSQQTWEQHQVRPR